MRYLKTLEFWCLVLLVINVATVASDVYFRHTAQALVPFRAGQVISGTFGITSDGARSQTAHSCHLLRYASIYCGFCSPKYSQAWSDLEKTLTSKGCDSIVVTPYSGDFPLADGNAPEQRLVGVSLQFARSTRFSSTPITLLLDRDWRIVWSHIGVLDSNDSSLAMRLAGF